MIEDGISIMCFVVVLIIGNYIERKRFGTILTPFFFLSSPFTLVCLICLLFNNKLQFIPFSPVSLYVWTIGLILFLFGEYIIISINKNSTIKQYQTISNQENNYFVFNILTIIAILYIAIKFKSIDVESIGNKETGEEVGAGGLTGRFANILLIAIPFYVTYQIPKLIKCVLLLLMFIFLVSLGSKTWLMYCIISGFITYSYKSKINLYLLVGLIAILFGAFLLYYKLNVDFDENNEFISFALRHFYFYITSGVLPFSAIISDQLNIVSPGVFHPFTLLIRSWIGEEIVIHSTINITTDLIVGKQSNVFTFFGNLWILGKDFDFVIMSILSGLISYFWFIQKKKYNNIFLQIGWGYTVATLFFGWYNWGFGLLRIWEIYTYCYLLFIISSYKIKI